MGKFPIRSLLIGAAVLGLVVFVASQNNARNSSDTQNYSYFLRQLNSQQVESVIVKDGALEVETKSGESYTTRVGAPLSTARPKLGRATDRAAADPADGRLFVVFDARYAFRR